MRVRSHFPSYPLPFQEVVNKRPKKSGAPEEDDSGVEVYYREGEDEVEEPKLPPRVSLTTESGEGFGEELLVFPELSCPSPCWFSIKQWVVKHSYLSQPTSLRTGSVNTNNMFIKNGMKEVGR